MQNWGERMKTTRRGALVVMVGSSVALVTNTLGFSRAEVARNVEIDVVGDETAYLTLRDDEIEDGGILFESDEPREAPESFDVKNQLTESLDVTLEFDDEDELRFVSADGNAADIDVADKQVLIEGLDVGHAVEIEIGVPHGSEEVLEGTIDIQAEGSSVYVQAKRTVSLEGEPVDPVLESDLAIELSPGRRGNPSIFIDLFFESVDEGTQVTLEARVDRPNDDIELYETKEEIFEPGSKIDFLVSTDPVDEQNVNRVTSVNGESPDTGRNDPVETSVEGFDVVIDPDTRGRDKMVELTVEDPGDD